MASRARRVAIEHRPCHRGRRVEQRRVLAEFATRSGDRSIAGWRDQRSGAPDKTTGSTRKLLSKSYRGALVGKRPKRRRPRLGPAIRHDAEGFDEALPAAREGDRHPEIEHLVVGEVPA